MSTPLFDVDTPPPARPAEAEPRLVLVLAVRGTPAPQGSKKGFVNRYTGRVQLVESSAKVKPWREAVRSEAVDVLGPRPPVEGPLMVDMVFTLPKPVSAPKRRRTWPEKKPDLSKLVRSTEDALTDAGAYRDDSQIVEFGRVAKVFPGEDPDALDAPGVVIRIYTLGATT